MLVIMSGLPGTGKSTICRAVARQTGAVHLRIDTIEQAVVNSGLAEHPVGTVGHHVGYALAGDYLQQGLEVLADSVNPLAVTRDAWRAVALANGVEALEVEVMCSDGVEHRRRAESRPEEIPGLVWPDWDQIASRRYEPWARQRLVLDTAHLSPHEAAGLVVQAMGTTSGT